MRVRVQVREARSADTGSPLFGARAAEERNWLSRTFDSIAGPSEFGFAAAETSLNFPAADPARLYALAVYLPNAADEASVNWYDAPAVKSDGTAFKWAGGEPVESYVVEGDPPRAPSATATLVRGLWLTTQRVQPTWRFTVTPASLIDGNALFLEGDLEADIGVWPQPQS
jgi:hypothetical protein